MSHFIVFLLLLNTLSTSSIYGAGLKKFSRNFSQIDTIYAEITTHEGVMKILLNHHEAPNTVANFESLAKSKFYDGIIFHRIIQQFMVQTGDPKGNGTGGPGYKIPFEKNELSHEIGVISMANTGDLNSGGSQFFIVQYPQKHLDGKHTVFGRVVDGLDVIYRLEKGDPMITVKIIEINKSTEAKGR